MKFRVLWRRTISSKVIEEFGLILRNSADGSKFGHFLVLLKEKSWIYQTAPRDRPTKDPS